MDLSVILKSIIPDNIKRIPLVQTCADVFAEMLSRNSLVSYRIQKLFDVDDSVFYRRDESGVLVADEPLQDLESEAQNETDETRKKVLTENIEYRKYAKECRNNLKKGLFYTYLAVMFSLIEELCRDSAAIDTIKKRNISTSKLFENVYDIVNSEYLGAFRYFQQSSGTENAIRYIYQFSRYLETGTLDNSLELETGDPFFLMYNGELHKSVFQVFNMPMSHPCGWCFQYNTITKQAITDYYGIKLVYSVNTVTLQWKSKKIYFGELPRGIATDNVVWERAIYTVKEKLTNNELVHVVSDRTPRPDGQYISKVNLKVTSVTVDETGTLIAFDSGNALCVYKGNGLHNSYEVRFGPSSAIHTEGAYVFPVGTKLLPFDNPEPEYQILYKDQMIMEETIEPSGDSKAVYYEDDFSKAFRLVGDPYPFCSGVDESRHKLTNTPNVMSKFTCTIQYQSTNLTYLRVEDDYGHFRAVVRDQTLTQNALNKFSVNTHGYYGEYLTFRAYDGLDYNYDHYIRTNQLNKTSSTVKVTSFSIDNRRIQFTAETSLSGMVIKVTMGSRSVTKRPSASTYQFSEDTSAQPIFAQYRVEVTDHNDTVIIEGNGLNNTAYNFHFEMPAYPAAKVVKPKFTNCTPGTMSPEPAGKDLGALNETPTLMWVRNTILEDPHYIRPDGIVYISELTPYNHAGCVYVNRGYNKLKSKTLDVMNVACTKYIEDEFYCETSGANNWLEFDNPASDGSLGKYLVCRFNTDPQTNVVRGMLRGYVLTFN